MGLKLVSGSDHGKYVQAFNDIIGDLALCSSTADREKSNSVFYSTIDSKRSFKR